MGKRETDPQKAPKSPRWSRRGLTQRGAKAYQVVLEAVLCVPAGALLGWGVDEYFESGPWGVTAGLLLGFIAFVLNVMKLPERLARLPEDDLREEEPKPPQN